MRHDSIFNIVFILTVLTLVSVTEGAYGQEAPRTLVQPNAPGWITVSWEHTGEGVFYFTIHRQDAPYKEDVYNELARSENRTDSLTDKNLTADTLYKYRVCAVYLHSWTCADWVSATTLPAPPPASGGSSPGSNPPAPVQPSLRTPELTATTNHPLQIRLHWGSGDQAYLLKNVELFRNGKVVFDARQLGGFIPEHTDSNLRANTAYRYKVCFTSLSDETKCSNEITARAQPIAPTAPADVVVSQNRARGDSRDFAALIRTLTTARWRNTEIPGQIITLERQDRVQLNQYRVGPAWVEIEQTSADSDPSELTADTTPARSELLTNRGNTYRVCAVVASLGPAGKVCSAAVSSQTADSPKEPITKVSLAELNVLAGKGESIANEDPLAAELRNREAEGPSRRGFDIGMAAAEGQTLPGPGKQRIHDSLSPAEQGAFDTAVSFSLQRNNNADLAKNGAAIAELDPIVAEARTREPDVLYWLGFDIATGIFGDPALGAKGNTATGPGSLGIRDGLSAAGQKGFNASVALHLSRKYR